MRITLGSDGLHVLLRFATETRQALGFVAKPRSRMMFSERQGGWRGCIIGPLYLRTYHRVRIA